MMLMTQVAGELTAAGGPYRKKASGAGPPDGIAF